MPSHTRRKGRSHSINRRGRKNHTMKRVGVRSLSRSKNVVTTKIGEGAFGTVSRPPARCHHFFSKNSKNIDEYNVNSIVFQETYLGNPKYVSKLTEYSEAVKEIEIANIIREKVDNWRDYFCLVEFICPAPKEKWNYSGTTELDTYAISEFCGETLDKILSGTVYLAPFELCDIVTALKELLYGIGQLHANNIFYGDFHTGNIVYNFTDKRLRIIDFGFAKLVEEDSKITMSKLKDIKDFVYFIIEQVLDSIDDLLSKKEVLMTPVIEKCHTEIKDILDKIPSKRRVFMSGNNDDKIHTLLEFIIEFLESE